MTKPDCPRCKDKGVKIGMNPLEERVTRTKTEKVGRKCPECGLVVMAK